MLLRRYPQLVVERVVPDLLHVVPVRHDAVLDRVLEREDAALGLRLVADVRVFLAHADHDALVPRATDDGGEDGARGVVAREAGFDHPGAVIAHERGDFAFVGHCRCVFCGDENGWISEDLFSFFSRSARGEFRAILGTRWVCMTRKSRARTQRRSARRRRRARVRGRERARERRERSRPRHVGEKIGGRRAGDRERARISRLGRDREETRVRARPPSPKKKDATRRVRKRRAGDARDRVERARATRSRREPSR